MMYDDDSVTLKTKKNKLNKKQKNSDNKIFIFFIFCAFFVPIIIYIFTSSEKSSLEIEKEELELKKNNLKTSINNDIVEKIEIKKEEPKIEEKKEIKIEEKNEENKKVNANLNEKYNYIHFLISFDERGLFPGLVAITSILETRAETTFPCIHVMLPDDFSNKSKEKVNSVYKIYKNFNLTMYHVGHMFDEFKNLFKAVTKPCFFRLGAPYIIKDVDLFIYIDIDVVVNTDLYEMYTMDMKNLYFRGILDFWVVQKKVFDSIYTDPYINTGVLLMNAKKIREEINFKRFLYFHKRHITTYNDQSIINDIGYPFIGILPPKYGLYLEKRYQIERFARDLIGKKYSYNLNELLEASKNLSITHFAGVDKPWGQKKVKLDQWKKYAQKTLYYEEIKNRYGFS